MRRAHSLTRAGPIQAAFRRIARYKCVGTRISQPRGRLRVSCGKGVAINALGPVLPEFLDRYPHVMVELTITDRVVDLIAENVDVAIRL